MGDTVMGLTLLVDMMTWWNTCHESRFQLRLIWRHVTSWPSRIHNTNLGWFAPRTRIPKTVYKLYEAMSTSLTRLVIWPHWGSTQFGALPKRYSSNLSENVYNPWLKSLVLFSFPCAISCKIRRHHSLASNRIPYSFWASMKSVCPLILCCIYSLFSFVICWLRLRHDHDWCSKFRHCYDAGTLPQSDRWVDRGSASTASSS